MRKIMEKAAWLTTQGDLFACPVCKGALHGEGPSLVCGNGHRYDLAKKGTVNFLAKPVPTEYTAHMLAARRRILSAGFFDPFLTAIQAGLRASDRLLDIGCGEGTPTAKLAPHVASAVGFDISAPAINLAGALMSPAFFCVADLARLPFLPATFDVVVDLFSPGAYAEFDRVLRSGGRLFKIIPTAGYLRELRAGLYAGTPKAEYSNRDVKDRFLVHYPKTTVQTIAYDFLLDKEQFADLMTMTPLAWQAPADRRQAMLERPPASMHVEVELLQVDNCQE
ncbi:methyltransferase domain-containing protein [Lacticaseibacillus daqingensis]|uniref:methyltransferase domain-containing protein n=1 Tax=Lacticaseibacillus daqingensis TaxID=2486014 RepID=UPI000F79DA21|nr:methyltransferase domain-containing protein [Lacticaseibacillus daqingensis]